MKKITALALALVMMLTLFAGCGKKEPVETAPQQQLPASALEILENVWAKYGDDEKFSVPVRVQYEAGIAIYYL